LHLHNSLRRHSKHNTHLTEQAPSVDTVQMVVEEEEEEEPPQVGTEPCSQWLSKSFHSENTNDRMDYHRTSTSRPLRGPQLPESACTDNRLYRKNNLRAPHSVDSAQMQEKKEKLGNIGVVDPHRTTHARIETILEEQQMETTQTGNKWQELLDMKKLVDTMQLKVDGLQIDMKSEFHSVSKTLSEQKKKLGNTAKV